MRVLQITIVWYAFFTFLCGFAQDFTQLFIFRALQGLGFGGEWAAGAVLMGEVIQDRYRGRAVGLVQTGWSIGWGAAALLYTLLIAVLPEEYAWRSLFWIGLAPAGLVFWIRRYIEEPEIRRNREAPAGFMHIFSALKPPYLTTTWRVVMMVAGAQGGGYALGVWLPTYLKTVRGISAVGTGGYTLVLILGAFFGFVTGAYLADGIGRKSTFMLSAIASIVLTLVYLFAPISNAWFLPVGFVLGYVSLIMFSPMGSFMTELYPTAVRGTGQGFCYNAGRGIGALFPALVGFLADAARPGTGDRGVQPGGLRHHDRGAAAAAGDARALADEPGTDRGGVGVGDNLPADVGADCKIGIRTTPAPVRPAANTQESKQFDTEFHKVPSQRRAFLRFARSAIPISQCNSVCTL